MGKDSTERRILGTACIDTKLNLATALPHVANPHLLEVQTITGTLDAVVIFPTAETIPHGSDIRRDNRSCPVGISMIGDHASQVLEGFVFIFNRRFQSVLTVQIQDNAALIKSMPAVILCFDRKREIPFFR